MALPRTLTLALLPVALTLGSFASAADTTQPASQPTSQPASPLEQLSRETEQIYRRVRPEMIRVKLPTPDWLRAINEQRTLIQKWGGQLTPQVRELLAQRQQQLTSMLRGETSLSNEPTTGPAPATRPVVALPPLLDPRLARSRLVLIATGLIIDSSGHALVPAFIDPDSLHGSLTVVTGDGRMTAAKLIGSDRPSNLSVVQLDAPDVAPAVLATVRPKAGSLVVTLAGDGSARLVIWNPSAPEPGLVVMTDGTVAGFGANGRFLAATACRPIVGQILATGSVHRAVLGVRVREMTADDLTRCRAAQRSFEPSVPWPSGAGESAMSVVDVEPDSAAAHAGLQRGDLILTAGGQAVEDTATFAALIATERGPTPLTVLRDQRVRTVSVDLLPPP